MIMEFTKLIGVIKSDLSLRPNIHSCKVQESVHYGLINNISLVKSKQMFLMLLTKPNNIIQLSYLTEVQEPILMLMQ